jgi:hypothetical protein
MDEKFLNTFAFWFFSAVQLMMFAGGTYVLACGLVGLFKSRDIKQALSHFTKMLLGGFVIIVAALHNLIWICMPWYNGPYP